MGEKFRRKYWFIPTQSSFWQTILFGLLKVTIVGFYTYTFVNSESNNLKTIHIYVHMDTIQTQNYLLVISKTKEYQHLNYPVSPSVKKTSRCIVYFKLVFKASPNISCQILKQLLLLYRQYHQAKAWGSTSLQLE